MASLVATSIASRRDWLGHERVRLQAVKNQGSKDRGYNQVSMTDVFEGRIQYHRTLLAKGDVVDVRKSIMETDLPSDRGNRDLGNGNRGDRLRDGI